MQLFDTLSGRKESLPREKGKPLNLFVCGPTVYDYLHIGNARTYLVFDAFVKFLRSEKIKVFYLQNITDVDDKIIARAKEEKTSPEVIAQKYTAIYRRNMRNLLITAVDTYASATEFIPQIVTQIQTLIDKGYAYKIPNDGWYFDISKFHNYGRLARRTREQAEDGVSRIDESVEKRNKGDFCLWKFSHDGDPNWKTELGEGRPGWHIEDTAISEHYFGSQYELHGGGVDLKFPHHEAEIAQQESASGKAPFVKIWMHVGALTINGVKMSKSKNNYVTIEDFLKKYSANILRLIALTHHYRSPLNYTESMVEDHVKSWATLLEFLGKLRFVEKHAIVKHNPPKGKIQEFDKALENDFNTPAAIGVIFRRVGELQPKVWKFSKSEARGFYSDITACLKSLGFSPEPPKIPRKIEELSSKREQSRRNKQFVQADGLRGEIERLGYIVEDTPLGPYICQKNLSSKFLPKI